MSESEGRKLTIDFPKLDELEGAVVRALRQLEVWRERAAASEAERRRLQDVLDDVKGGSKKFDPAAAADELKHLRDENEALRSRLQEGRQMAEQLAREVQFLEDAR
jgi:predicted outer membrane protein